MITVHTHSQLSTGLFTEWQSAWEKSPLANFINTPNWIRAMADCFAFDSYKVITVYKNKTLAAAVAVVRVKQFGISVYTVPPGDFVCGFPVLFIQDEVDVRRALIKELLLLGTVLFDNVPQSFVDCITSVSSRISPVPFSVNLYFDIEHDENGKIILPKRKRLMREAKPILERIGFESYAGDRQDLLPLAFQIDAQSRKYTRGYNAFSDTSTQKMYASLAAHFKDALRINFLSVDKNPVVYEMGFLIGKTYFGSQIAFDERYKQYSPGKTFEVKLIEYMDAHGIRRIDYGSGDNFIKRTITQKYNNLYKVILSSNPLVRLYLRFLFASKDTLFTYMSNHNRIYSWYKNTRRILHV